MIGYVTLGTNDIDRALAFYDALFAELGARRLLEIPDERRYTLYGRSGREPMIAITRPADGNPATVGNGSMVALPMRSREQVDSFHRRALELGGSEVGAPGVRGPEEMGFYGGYFRDPDGNKLCAFHITRGR